MALEVGVWKLGDKPKKINMSIMSSEAKLEDTLVEDITILSPELMLIGRQIATAQGKFIDLLAMNMFGNLTVVELKKNKGSREVVGQLLDYACWVENLTYEEIANIYAEKNGGKKLEEGFYDAFGTNTPEKLNQSHDLMIVCCELDASTERIVNYLVNNYGVPINAVFFYYFTDEGKEYLTRTWLIEPEEVESRASKADSKKGGEVWNGRDFYVSLGEGEHRRWEDCRKYGFISGGQKPWHSRTLKLLFVDSRVFVNIPKTGYVGVGIVKGTSVSVKDFKVNVEGKEIPILEAELEAPNMGENADNPELSEYLVRVEWIKTVSKKEAYKEKGFFGIQHTACRLRNHFTLEKLIKHFGLNE